MLVGHRPGAASGVAACRPPRTETHIGQPQTVPTLQGADKALTLNLADRRKLLPVTVHA